MTELWRELRQSFDQVAERYEQIRPGYPEQLFEDVIEYSGLHAGAQLLEIGCGTGQATLPFAQRGYTMVCLEPGAQLAALAKHKCANYPAVTVEQATFETFESEQRFDLIFSATAFHWVDPNIRFQKVASLLKPDGTLAVWWNTHVYTDASQGFFEEVQAIYEQTVPALTEGYKGLLTPEQIDQAYGHEFANATQFGPLKKQVYPWNQRYTADQYIGLLGTYSGHIHLAEHERSLLFERIARLINTRYEGAIIKGYAALLYLGKLAKW